MPTFIEAIKKDDALPAFDLDAHRTELHEFMMDRVRQLFGGQSLRHDIIDAVVEGDQPDIANILDSAKTLDEHKGDQNFKDSVEALTRVLRIAKKAEFDPSALEVDPALFEHPSEGKLYDAVSELQTKAQHQTIAQSFADLTKLQPIIAEYFDENMIMADDEKIKNNRLKQLTILAGIVFMVGNLDELIVKWPLTWQSCVFEGQLIDKKIGCVNI